MACNGSSIVSNLSLDRFLEFPVMLYNIFNAFAMSSKSVSVIGRDKRYIFVSSWGYVLSFILVIVMIATYIFKFLYFYVYPLNIE